MWVSTTTWARAALATADATRRAKSPHGGAFRCRSLCHAYSVRYKAVITSTIRHQFQYLTSCAGAATICPRPSPPSVGAEAPRAAEPTAPADDNVAVGSHAQYVPTLTAAAALRVKPALSKAAWWPWPWPFDLESGVRVTCDVGYVCANLQQPTLWCGWTLPPIQCQCAQAQVCVQTVGHLPYTCIVVG